MSIELFDDDIEAWKDEFSTAPWKKITNADVRNSCQLPIRISYEYVDMGCSMYGFNQLFEGKDSYKYFSYMKYISGKTIDELLSDDKLQLRRHSALHKPLRDTLNSLSAKIVQGEPIIFHFGLYTHKTEMASREKNIRAPRIYFMQGLYGTIYSLFFDPYHEITR